jgi:hypothetical protein
MTNAWVRERFAFAALEYPIPARSNRLDFMLGALTLVALTLLGVTGIVLTPFYNPTPLGAQESVSYVITRLPLVTFFRDLHVWSATGAIVLVFTHLAADTGHSLPQELVQQDLPHGRAGDADRFPEAARRGGRSGRMEPGEIRSKMFRHTHCAARLQTIDQGTPVTTYTVAREMGHGGEAMVRKVYGHLGQVRHRAEAVEYRVEQHAAKLGARLEALRGVGFGTTIVAPRRRPLDQRGKSL